MVIKKSAAALNKALKFLNDGKIIVCPTDTVYGFLADAENKRAVEKIYRIKKRPKSKYLAVFIKDLNMARELAEINTEQGRIIKRYWPGKHTFVFKRKPGVKLYGVDKKTIALRIPKHNFLNDLLKKINKPLAQTSVNISGKPSLKKISDIIKKFALSDYVMLIINGGNLSKSRPSTIIDLSTDKIKIFRK